MGSGCFLAHSSQNKRVWVITEGKGAAPPALRMIMGFQPSPSGLARRA
jgi:hypothetical protein